MDIYVVAYIVLEQLLATSMLIVPRWAGIIRGVEAVSYTHLDVYKRQVNGGITRMLQFDVLAGLVV